MVLHQLLASVQPQSFLEWTCTIFEQSLEEFHTILPEDLGDLSDTERGQVIVAHVAEA
jgi:hypothetical protein